MVEIWFGALQETQNLESLQKSDNQLFLWFNLISMILNTLQALTDPDRDVNVVIDLPLKGKVAKKVRNSTTVGELLKKVTNPNDYDMNHLKLATSMTLLSHYMAQNNSL